MELQPVGNLLYRQPVIGIAIIHKEGAPIYYCKPELLTIATA
jgi:hypothetical protein